MNGYTAEEYKRAADLLREQGHDHDELADEWVSRAQNMERLAALIQDAVASVRTFVNELDPYRQTADEWHMRLAAKLIDDGWTPPEGLF